MSECVVDPILADRHESAVILLTRLHGLIRESGTDNKLDWMIDLVRICDVIDPEGLYHDSVDTMMRRAS